KLIAGKDKHLAVVIFLNIAEVLAHRVGSPLVPVGCFEGLLSRQDLDEATPERIEFVGIGNVAVQADAEELGQDVDTVEATVDAVANGDIDEPVFAGNRHGRLASV